MLRQDVIPMVNVQIEVKLGRVGEVKADLQKKVLSGSGTKFDTPVQEIRGSEGETCLNVRAISNPIGYSTRGK